MRHGHSAAEVVGPEADVFDLIDCLFVIIVGGAAAWLAVGMYRALTAPAPTEPSGQPHVATDDKVEAPTQPDRTSPPSPPSA